MLTVEGVCEGSVEVATCSVDEVVLACVVLSDYVPQAPNVRAKAATAEARTPGRPGFLPPEKSTVSFDMVFARGLVVVRFCFKGIFWENLGETVRDIFLFLLMIRV